jgi:uncharacterized protein (DUF58 family)
MNRQHMTWRQRWELHFYNWIDKRSPRAGSVKLTHKNLYTFPNRSGLLFLLLILVIWLLGTNYQNNLILAISYLLVSLFVASILHGYSNMAGLEVRFITAHPAFAGEPAAFVLELSSRHKAGCEHLELRWPGGDTQVLSLDYDTPQQLTLWAKSNKRGHFQPGRLLVQSYFPLGIIRCWSWLNLDASALIYPQPLVSAEPHAYSQAGTAEGESMEVGGDDFHSLREYQPGDPIKHIAWKQYAKDKGLFTKEYQQALAAEKWLNWDSLNLPQEQRLSGLCYWALCYEQQQLVYGLQLPGLELAPARGSAHRQRVLSALAEFNCPSEPSAQPKIPL